MTLHRKYSEGQYILFVVETNMTSRLPPEIVDVVPFAILWHRYPTHWFFWLPTKVLIGFLLLGFSILISKMLFIG
jgi:uncharacterized RDD family membrane protein YckC